MGRHGLAGGESYALAIYPFPRGAGIIAPVKSIFIKCIQVAVLAGVASVPLHAQGNYEIQVYGSDTVAPGRTMVELHSNFTFEGFKTSVDGVLPDEHQVHETVEITQGWTSWFETGFYIFTSYGPHQGYKWVGDHIRPRVRVPDSWHWPVGVSLSTEIGYQRPIFSADTWTWEIRPIVDKQLGLGTWPSIRPSKGPFTGPAYDRAWPSLPTSRRPIQSPENSARAWNTTDLWDPSPGSTLSMSKNTKSFPRLIMISARIGSSISGWELGVTRSTDHLLVKMIIGHRFRFITPHVPRILKPNGQKGSE